jgi:hypothetical protein
MSRQEKREKAYILGYWVDKGEKKRNRYISCLGEFLKSNKKESGFENEKPMKLNG